MSPVRAISLETQDDIHGEVMRRLFGQPSGSPKKFGRYEVVGRLGAGAMGSVYLARDPELDREVAIKILRLHLAADRDRLAAEAQAMARLSHPNVVAVFDVGDAAGQIFVAMERVDGVDLRVWQEDERPWRETVRVYLAAARGLAAAHDAGIVHRDFKPDNVLIGRDGAVKVSDFGVATVLPQEALVETLRDAEPTSDPWLLATAGAGGTPAYMSPEQLRGLAADPQSDQFSFCVAMFEALAGYRPYTDDNIVDLIKRTTEGEQRSPPASTRVPSEIWRIIRQGLAADPARRHPSMDALCSTIEHAMRPAWRRRWALTSVGVVLASAVGGAASYRHFQRAACTEHATEATRAWEDKRDGVRDGLLASAAGFAATTSEQVNVDLSRWTAAWETERTDVCASTEAQPVEQTRRILCLDGQLREFRGLLSVLSTPDPVVAENALRAVGGLGDPTRCVDAQWLAATQPVPPDSESQADVDAARGALARARALTRAGKEAAALELADAQRELATSIDYAPLAAEASLSIGIAQIGLGNYEDAEAALVAAVSQANAAAAPQTGALAAIELVSAVGARLERFGEGRTWATLAAGYIDRLGPAGRDLAAERLLALAQLESRQRDLPRALELVEAVRDLYEEIDAPPLRWLSLWGVEATVRSANGESELALDLRRRVEQTTAEIFGEDHPSVARSHLNLGIALAKRGDFEGASARLRSALQLNVDAYGADHPDNARILNNLANVAMLTNDPKEAENLQLEAIALNQKAYGPNDPRILNNLTNLGVIQLRQGRIDEAETTLQTTVEGYEAARGPDHLDVAEALLNLATVTSQKNDLQRTKALLLRAKKIFDATSETVGGRGATLHNLANVTRSLGDHEQALEFAREAVDVVRASHGPDHPEFAMPRALHAALLVESGQLDAAREATAQLLPFADNPAVHPGTASSILLTHAELLWTDGDRKGAQTAADKALALAEPETEEHDAVKRWLEGRR